MHWKTILCPTDYTGLSEAALRYAAALAHDYHARLVVLHAVETLGPENLTYGEAISQAQPDAYRQRLFEELRQRVGIQDPQLEQILVLSEEDPVAALVDAAVRHSCDLIVIGTHEHHGWRRWLERSLAEKVVQLAPCPVLVVKEHQSPRAKAEEARSSLHPQHLTLRFRKERED
jgi:nucleotide-binding universal stress UspA family protein